jgi:thioredoxin reductase (NADPH)
MRRKVPNVDLLVVGAGPAGIALVAEARAAGVPAEKIVVLEKAHEHSWIIRKYYPASKPVLANYKGIEAKCEGVLCIPDLTREETLTYLDRAIRDSGVEVRYRNEVFRISREEESGRLLVESSGGNFRARNVVIAIGILGRPNKPGYPIPRSVNGKVFFDVTSERMQELDVLVVGGGDTATEYCQFLVQEGNRVSLSYRGEDLTRPNPINRDSVLALAASGRLRLLLGSDISGLEADEDRIRVNFARGGLEPLVVDRIIYALGGTTPENFLKAIGIAFDGPAPRLTNAFGTTVPGLFLAGDLTAGKRGGSIILAFNTAAAAMRQICQESGICAVNPR